MDSKQMIVKIESVRKEINQSFENQLIDFDKIDSDLGSVVKELTKLNNEQPTGLKKSKSNPNADKELVFQKSVRTADFN